MPERKYIVGVDLAKIIAMLFVVMVHVSGFALPHAPIEGHDYAYALVKYPLRSLFMTCIDLFGICTGFVGIFSSGRYSRLVELWLQMVVTGVVICCMAHAFGMCVSGREWHDSLLPVASRQYWYMTSYFMLALCMPILNKGILALQELYLRRFLIAVVLIVGVETACGMGGGFKSAGALGLWGGFSFGWLVVLYVIGAYWRLYGVGRLSRILRWWIVIPLLCLTGWVAPVAVALKWRYLAKLNAADAFNGYTSFATVLASCWLFSCCIAISVSRIWIIRLVKAFATVSLSVYLVHFHPLVFWRVLQPYLKTVECVSASDWFFKLVGISVLLYLVIGCLDGLRHACFRFIGYGVHLVPLMWTDGWRCIWAKK